LFIAHGESYDIAEAPSRDAAEAVARAYLDRLETEQPSAASGGQGDGGIQDRIYILTPDGQRHRYVRPVEG